MVTELREGVWWLDLRGVNAYLVDDGGRPTLVDAGTPLDAGAIEAAVDAAGFSVADLERVLVTHYDVDHVGALAKLGTGAPVYVGAEDAPLVAGARPAPSDRKALVQLATDPFVPAVEEARVHPVSDGDEIGGFVAYHAPGHTAGHTVYVHEERSAAFLGDLVRESRGELRASPWAVSADSGAVAESVRDVAARLPDVEVAAMGHGTPFERGGCERLAELADEL